MTERRFTPEDVQILSQDTVFQGYFRMDRYVLRHRRFDGTWTQDVTREIFERGHATVVLLYDPDRDRVAMIEQFRPGALAAGWYPWLVECVAGIIEDGETPEGVAWRESAEEAGATPTAMIEVGKYLVTAGGSSESCALFCARIDSSVIDGLHGLAEEGEDIRVFTIPSAEAYEMTKDGRICNSMAVLAVQWLMLEKQTILKRWAVSG